MTDLRNHLADLAGSPGEPTTVQADADLARGRTALRRRRILQSATGSALVVAVAAAAIGFTTAGGPAGAGVPQAGGATTATTTSTTAASTGSFKLVAYTGEQPKGFSVDKVPSGWEVQGITESALTLGPIGAKPHNSAEPQGDVADDDPNSFVGKVVVMLQSVDENGAMPGPTTPVKVGDQDGVFVQRPDSGDGVTLFIKQPSGINLEIQVWDGIGWTRDQIVDFAAGIHVSKDAQPGRG